MFKFILLNFDENFNKFNSRLKLVKDKYLRDITADEIYTQDNSEEVVTIPYVSFYDVFCKKQKDSSKIFDKLHFNLSRESVNFKFNFYKTLKDVSSVTNINLNFEEIECLKQYKRSKPFLVIDCDKKVGLCIIKQECYNKFAFEQLNVAENFEEISYNPLPTTISEIEKILLNLCNLKSITKKLYLKLLPKKTSKLGSFRLLAKLHKQKLGFRPIINSISHPTSSLSLLIDCLLQPFIKKNASYIQDSQHLIQQARYKTFPSTSKQYSCDFEGLYSNINLDHALILISEFISTNFDSSIISSFGFHTILELVFKNNIFTFNNKYYKQILGIAMGSISGPSVANMYIWLLEKNFLEIHKPLSYSRFIDDIHVIVLENFDINILINLFEEFGLKLNIVSSEEVIFLDLLIKINPYTGKLNFSLYTKPTATFSYLLADSNHPNFIFENNPKSLLLRFRRINSNFSDYCFSGGRLIKQMTSRGYDHLKVSKVFQMIAKTDYDSIIDYKVKKDIMPNKYKPIHFTFPYETNLNKYSIDNSFNTAANELFSNEAFSNNKLKVINTMQKNLSSTLVHNSSLVLHNNHKYTNCLENNCGICKYSLPVTYLKLNDFYLPILNNSSCDAKNAVYIIKCIICDSYYIGQTECIKTRLYTHIRGCKFNIIPHSNNCSGVVEHFNKNDTCVINYFSFVVFRNNINNKFNRLNIETQLIHLFIDLGIKIMNDKIPDKYYWYSNTKLFELKEK